MIPLASLIKIFGVAIFTPDEREMLRSELVSIARNDPHLSGAAHTGSAAAYRLDRWSDIDLALCLKAGASHDLVVAEWTERLYARHAAVAHVDVWRGPTLFRVFLLESTLQVDVAFWREEDFAPIGTKFQLIFGRPQPLREVPRADPMSLAGMAWLYALHVRSSLARGRILQAEYMLNGMRNHVGELVCLRYGVESVQGRGLDDLPPAEREAAKRCVPHSSEEAELKRAFKETMQALLEEIRRADSGVEEKLAGPLQALLS